MGKSKKRSRSDEESDDLRKRLKRLERMLLDRDRKSSRHDQGKQRQEKSREDDKENRHASTSCDTHINETNVPMTITDSDSEATYTEVYNKEQGEGQADLGDIPSVELVNPASDQNTELPQQADVILDEEILQVLGEDPAMNKINEVNLHPGLAARWTAWIASGVSTEIRDGLLKKYGRTGNCTLEAPKLNPEMEASLNETALARDKKFIHEQNLVGSALSALGAGITMILREEEEPVDRVRLLECLSDAGKLLTDLHHSESRARKAFISPGISKQVKILLEKAGSGSLLFGENLADRIKEAKSLEKLAKDLKIQQPTTAVKKNTSKPRYLNWKSPSGKRQGPSQMGNRSKFQQRAATNLRGRQSQSQSHTQNSARPQTERTSRH